MSEQNKRILTWAITAFIHGLAWVLVNRFGWDAKEAQSTSETFGYALLSLVIAGVAIASSLWGRWKLLHETPPAKPAETKLPLC